MAQGRHHSLFESFISNGVNKFPSLRISQRIIPPNELPRPSAPLPLPVLSRHKTQMLKAKILAFQGGAMMSPEEPSSADSGYENSSHNSSDPVSDISSKNSVSNAHNSIKPSQVPFRAQTMLKIFKSATTADTGPSKAYKKRMSLQGTRRNSVPFLPPQTEVPFTLSQSARYDVEKAHLERLRAIRKKTNLQNDPKNIKMAGEKLEIGPKLDEDVIKDKNDKSLGKDLLLGRGFPTKLALKTENTNIGNNQINKNRRPSLVKAEFSLQLGGKEKTDVKIPFTRECSCCTKLPAIPMLKRRNSEVVIKKRRNSDVVLKPPAEDSGFRPRLQRSNSLIIGTKPKAMKERFLDIKAALEPIANTPDTFRQEPSPVPPTPEPIRAKTPAPIRVKTPAPPKPKPKSHRGMNLEVSAKERKEFRKLFRKLDTDEDGHLMVTEVVNYLQEMAEITSEKVHLDIDAEDEILQDQGPTHEQLEYLKQVYQVLSAHTFFGTDELVTLTKLSEHFQNFEGKILASFYKPNAVDTRDALERYFKIFLALEHEYDKVPLEAFSNILCENCKNIIPGDEFLFRLSFDLGLEKDSVLSKLDYLVFIPYFLCLEKEGTPKRGRSNSILDMEHLPVIH